MSLQVAVLEIVTDDEGKRQAKLAVDALVYIGPISDDIVMLAFPIELPREIRLIDQPLHHVWIF